MNLKYSAAIHVRGRLTVGCRFYVTGCDNEGECCEQFNYFRLASLASAAACSRRGEGTCRESGGDGGRVLILVLSDSE